MTRDVHRRRSQRHRAVLHEPRSARLRARQSARDGEGRAVRALLAIGRSRCGGCSWTSSSKTSGRGRRSRRQAGSARAERLYQRVFSDYGDDSVAQLGGVHLAVEDASNILTKVLERGRLMAYLEQSTRYIPYTDRRGDALALSRAGRARRPPAARAVHRDDERGVRDLRALDRSDARVVRAALSEGRGRLRRGVSIGDSRQGARHAARAAAGGDAVERRASTAPGRPTRRCCCACARIRSPRCATTADAMLDELRKVIPAFLTRVDQPERGGRWSAYLAEHARRARATSRAPARSAPARRPARDEVTLTDFDPDGEVKVVAAALYASSSRPDDELLAAARRMSAGRARGGAARLRRRSRRTAGTSPAARSSARATASTCSPTTARSAICSATAC